MDATEIGTIALVDLDPGRLRAALALRGLRHQDFARQARVSRGYFSALLHERRQPGELSRLRIMSALARCGISVEEVRHVA